MSDCVVTTPETRPGVYVCTLTGTEVPCTRCGGSCGPRGGWAFNVGTNGVCRHCITAGELTLVDDGTEQPPTVPCLIRGAHLVEHPPGSPEAEECTGCIPAPAAPGSRVCTWHQDITRDRLKGAAPGPGRDRPRTVPSLAELYEALGTAPTGGGGDGGEAQAISDDRRNARSAIKAMLVSWCLVLAESPSNGGRGLTVPDEGQVRKQTAYAIFQAEASAIEADNDAAEEPDPLTAATLRRRATQHREHAARLRDQYAAGADVIAALCEHVDRHLTWLLNHDDHADQLVNDVANAWRWAWSLAGGGRNVPTLLCECGTRVPMPLAEDPEERKTQEFVCPGCGSWGVLSWWAATQGNDPGPMRLADLPAWLAHWHNLDVPVYKLRHWTRGDVIKGEHLPDCRGEERGECAGCARKTPLLEPVVVRGEDGEPLPVPEKGIVRRYDPHVVALVALRMQEKGRLRSAGQAAYAWSPPSPHHVLSRPRRTPGAWPDTEPLPRTTDTPPGPT